MLLNTDGLRMGIAITHALTHMHAQARAQAQAQARTHARTQPHRRSRRASKSFNNQITSHERLGTQSIHTHKSNRRASKSFNSQMTSNGRLCRRGCRFFYGGVSGPPVRSQMVNMFIPVHAHPSTFAHTLNNIKALYWRLGT